MNNLKLTTGPSHSSRRSGLRTWVQWSEGANILYPLGCACNQNAPTLEKPKHPHPNATSLTIAPLDLVTHYASRRSCLYIFDRFCIFFPWFIHNFFEHNTVAYMFTTKRSCIAARTCHNLHPDAQHWTSRLRVKLKQMGENIAGRSTEQAGA